MDHRTLLTLAGKSMEIPFTQWRFIAGNSSSNIIKLRGRSIPLQQPPEGIIWIIGQWCYNVQDLKLDPSDHHAPTLIKNVGELKWVWKPMQMIIFTKLCTKPEMVMVLWGRWFFPQLTMIKTRLIFWAWNFDAKFRKPGTSTGLEGRLSAHPKWLRFQPILISH